MRLIRRKDWGAPAQSPAAYIASTDGTKVHWLGTEYASRPHDRCDDYVRSIRASHLANKKENYVDIAYNLIACEHGYVFEGRGAHKRPGANGSASLNQQHYAILALHGTNSGPPSDLLLHALRDGIEYLRSHGKAGAEIKGHKDGYNTQCPGPDLYAWVKRGAPRPKSGAAKTTPASTAGTYAVKPGDTLSKIGTQLGIRWPEIASLNGIKSPYLIRPGQVLKLPKKSERPVVSLSKLIQAARTDPPKRGTPVSYSGVRVVEDALVAEGLLARSLADGHFGTATVKAYAAWQRRCGYRGRDADGIPGKASLARLGSKHGFTVKD